MSQTSFTGSTSGRLIGIKKEAIVVIIICAWCKKDMGEKAPFGNKEVTHGICQECLMEYFGLPPEIQDAQEIAENMESYWANLNAGSA